MLVPLVSVAVLERFSELAAKHLQLMNLVFAALEDHLQHENLQLLHAGQAFHES